MAKLYRDPTTDQYYTKARIRGEFVTLQIADEGKEFLLQRGVRSKREIPAGLMTALWENGWFSTNGEYPHIFSAGPGEPVQQPPEEIVQPVTDVRERRRANRQVPPPEVREEPRPWMEPGNAERFREETDPADADTRSPDQEFAATPADVSNADPVTHPEATAFTRNVWLWVLVAAVVLIGVWGLFEVI